MLAWPKNNITYPFEGDATPATSSSSTAINPDSSKSSPSLVRSTHVRTGEKWAKNQKKEMRHKRIWF